MPQPQQSLTLRQIAQLARTSKSTVSRVLTNHPNVSESTRRRVLEIINKHHFRPNLFARGLAGGRTGLVGVITTEINSGFFAEVLRGVDAVVGQHGGHVLTSFAHGSEDFQRLWEEMARGHKVDGIILVAPSLSVLDRAMEDHEPPVVLCACRPTRADGRWQSVDCAIVDNRQAFAAVMQHLYDTGRRRILFLAGPDDVWDAIERRGAVEAFAQEHSDVHLKMMTAPMTYENGMRCMQTYLNQGNELPQAVLATNDRMALGVAEVLAERGIRVPEQVAVAGCDDDNASRLTGLTTLHMPMVDLGREAATLLFERIGRGGDGHPGCVRVLSMALKIRRSTAGGALCVGSA
jgi:LacI family transcriptional regulator